jgi:hypothetical protein
MIRPPIFKRVQVLVGICALVVFISIALSSYTFVRQSQSDTIRRADRKSQNISQVATCFQQVENAPKVIRILGLIDVLAANSITVTQQSLDATNADDPLRKTREQALARLIPARNDLRTFILQTSEKAPSRASCNELAVRLGVDPKTLKR